MKSSQIMLASALAAVLGVSAQTSMAASDTEKCYGIAKAAQNNCAANGHACAGHASKSFDPKEWKSVPTGTCLEMKGTLKPM